MKTTYHVIGAFAAAFAGTLAPLAHAQLSADRTYYGVGRAIPMTVAVPEGTTGDAVIELFGPDAIEAGAEAKPTASAPVAAGSVNLATLFPTIWTEGLTTVRFAQLKVGETRVGSPVVLQPLQDATPPRMQGARPIFPARQGPVSGLRAYADRYVEMTTTEGTMTFRLRPDHAPNTVWNFRTLVEGGFYTDIVFHRIIGPSQGSPGFMAQVGDPTGTGGGGPGYVIDLENSKLPHDFGVLSMARTGDPNTNGSQVFVCFSREGTQGLDGLYCSFAQAVSGAETILKLGAHPTEAAPSGEMSKPKDPAPRLVSARLVDAPPLTQQPAPVASPAKPAPSR